MDQIPTEDKLMVRRLVVLLTAVAMAWLSAAAGYGQTYSLLPDLGGNGVISPSQINMQTTLDNTVRETVPSNLVNVWDFWQNPNTDYPFVHVDRFGGLWLRSFIMLANTVNGQAPVPNTGAMMEIWPDVPLGFAIRTNSIAGAIPFALLDQPGNFRFSISSDAAMLRWAPPKQGSDMTKVTWDTTLTRTARGVLAVNGKSLATTTQIAVLKTQMAGLQAQMAALQSQVVTLHSRLAALGIR
jgi:hypothetical protein